MRSSVGTASAGLALALAALPAAGCTGEVAERDEARVEADLAAAADRMERLERLLPGRWAGAPVEAPEGVWFERASFDVTFGPGGDISIVASTFARRPYALRFEGSYEVLDGDQVRVTEPNMGGIWKVARADPRALVIETADVKLDLRRRYGS
jgi:hypothetical protein